MAASKHVGSFLAAKSAGVGLPKSNRLQAHVSAPGGQDRGKGRVPMAAHKAPVRATKSLSARAAAVRVKGC